MKGFVPTPPAVVDSLIEKLFSGSPPSASSRILDPGCGPGAFIDGIIRWADKSSAQLPQIVGVEADSSHVDTARRRFAKHSSIEIRHANFLSNSDDRFDYVIGNPPYVSILDLSEEERARYRADYEVATNRFDLYALFFEQALRQLNPGGRLVFITPEKFLYVESARALRRALSEVSVDELHFFPEDTFGDLVTYPLVTTITKQESSTTSVFTREGERHRVRLPSAGESWQPVLLNAKVSVGPQLSDISVRISCGVATGADSQFVLREDAIPKALIPFSYRTISGRQLAAGQAPATRDRLLVPYDASGRLLAEESLGPLRDYLAEPQRKAKLLVRTCAERKPWYAFHENPPMVDILRPKLLCKDIGSAPYFFVDQVGDIVPRHSVYYIVPKSTKLLARLADYLNSGQAQEWLMKHCQRAAGGFIRLQSHVLKRIPVPAELTLKVLATQPHIPDQGTHLTPE